MNITNDLTSAEQAAIVALAADLPGTWRAEADAEATFIMHATDPVNAPLFLIFRTGPYLMLSIRMPSEEPWTVPLFREFAPAEVMIRAGVWWHAADVLTNAGSSNTKH